MGILDWLKGDGGAKEEPPGMSRRDFFARVAGRGAAGLDVEADAPATTDPSVLHRFHVAAFPFHDGPVLVPVLREGMELDLVPEAGHPTDPDAIRIQRKRDHLGYVPAELSSGIRALLDEGATLVCRVSKVSPNAELAKVLEVEVAREPEPEPDEAEEGAGEKGDGGAASGEVR